MASYVVETYLPRLGRRRLNLLARRLRRAAETVTRNGTPVVHVRSIHVPGDETCFHFFEAASAEAVDAAGKQAGIVFDRIAEALTTTQSMKCAPPDEAGNRSVRSSAENVEKGVMRNDNTAGESVEPR